MLPDLQGSLAAVEQRAALLALLGCKETLCSLALGMRSVDSAAVVADSVVAADLSAAGTVAGEAGVGPVVNGKAAGLGVDADETVAVDTVAPGKVVVVVVC